MCCLIGNYQCFLLCAFIDLYWKCLEAMENNSAFIFLFVFLSRDNCMGINVEIAFSDSMILLSVIFTSYYLVLFLLGGHLVSSLY